MSRVSSEIVLHEQRYDKRYHVGRFAHEAAFPSYHRNCTYRRWKLKHGAARMQQLLAIEFAGCEESSRANMAQKIKAAPRPSVRPCDDNGRRHLDCEPESAAVAVVMQPGGSACRAGCIQPYPACMLNKTRVICCCRVPADDNLHCEGWMWLGRVLFTAAEVHLHICMRMAFKVGSR